MTLDQIVEQLKAGATDEQLAHQMKSNPSAFGRRKEERLYIASEYRRSLRHLINKEGK
tara:strand:- start:917 stop:1090 length:174 start_codon:yes stop_codon:yes gene_type:complete